MSDITPDKTTAPEAPGAEGGITPGIYLEVKKSTIGTGGTAKVAEYRNFWVTLSICEASAVMVLLDDEFKPTPIKENFAQEIVTGAGWLYVPEGAKRYAQLRPYLDRMLAPPAPAKPAAAAASQGDGNWWSGGGAKVKPKTGQAAAPSKKGGWWEK